MGAAIQDIGHQQGSATGRDRLDVQHRAAGRGLQNPKTGSHEIGQGSGQGKRCGIVSHHQIDAAAGITLVQIGAGKAE